MNNATGMVAEKTYCPDNNKNNSDDVQEVTHGVDVLVMIKQNH
jgi:hypothetical protein